MEKNHLPLEIERKFIIDMPDIVMLTKQEGVTVSHITQTYLKGEGDTHARVRCRVCEGVPVYTHTSKKALSGMTKIEIETIITESVYQAYLKEADPARATLYKTRYAISHKGLIYEVDIYPFWEDQAIMEVELESETQPISPPPYLHIIREVTEDKTYSNRSLAAWLKTKQDI